MFSIRNSFSTSNIQLNESNHEKENEINSDSNENSPKRHHSEIRIEIKTRSKSEEKYPSENSNNNNISKSKKRVSFLNDPDQQQQLDSKLKSLFEETHTKKILTEKKELNELNSRLNNLVESIKQKKLCNDALEKEIKHEKLNTLSIYFDENEQYNTKVNCEARYRSQLAVELQQTKQSLNGESESNLRQKIRLTRLNYNLNKMQETYDLDLKENHGLKDKIHELERLNKEKETELCLLHERYDQESKMLACDAEKNIQLEEKCFELHNDLDREQTNRIDLECRIQTLLEQKKFEKEIFELMRNEFVKLSDCIKPINSTVNAIPGSGNFLFSFDSLCKK